jgi:hypothetical protein
MERAPQWSWSDILGTIGIVGLLLTSPAAAQQPQPPPPASASAQNPPEVYEKSNGDQNRKSQEKEASPKNDRIFWTLPNYLTVENAAHVSPLTTGGKFKLTAKDSFDPVEIPYISLLAAISQAQNSEPTYGQGAAGYGKRYGTAFADNTIGNFMTEAIFPSMLRHGSSLFSVGKRRILATHRLRVQPARCHPHRFRAESVQLFRDRRQRDWRRYCLVLPSRTRPEFLEDHGHLGHSDHVGWGSE